MQPEEKAKDIINKMLNTVWDRGSFTFISAKKQALIICKEVIYNTTNLDLIDYWKQVQIEINKIEKNF